MSGKGIISEEPFTDCQLCGTITECRPYGKNNEQICFDCGQLDVETTTTKMAEYLGLD